MGFLLAPNVSITATTLVLSVCSPPASSLEERSVNTVRSGKRPNAQYSGREGTNNSQVGLYGGIAVPLTLNRIAVLDFRVTQLSVGLTDLWLPVLLRNAR